MHCFYALRASNALKFKLLRANSILFWRSCCNWGSGEGVGYRGKFLKGKWTNYRSLLSTYLLAVCILIPTVTGGWQ